MPSCRRYFARFLLIFFVAVSNAQVRTVSGSVRDPFGEPLSLANILIEGTRTGTSTDELGQFVITADASDFLLVSYVGYASQRMQVGNVSDPVIILLPGYSLDEALVVGYGTTTRRQLTDNVATVEAAQIAEVPVPTLQGSLVGKMAGVQITQVGGRAEAGFNIRVRGVATLGNWDPLYVLDGIPLYKSDFSGNGSPINDLIALNPADIESIEVLKDASAAAIYGSRGSNGVVLITTKSGKQGKTRFSFTSSYGFSEPANKLEMLNTAEYVELFSESLRNVGRDEAFIASEFNRYALNEADWRDGAVDTDWQGLGLVSGSIQDIGFSASGGSESTTFFLSGSYNKTKGILRANRLERYTLRANLENRANNWLLIGLNSTLSKSQLSRGGGDGTLSSPTSLVYQIPFSSAFQADGKTPNSENLLYYNYLLDQYNGEQEGNIWRTFAKLYGQVTLTGGLDFRSEVGYDITDHLEESFFGSLTRAASVNGRGSSYNDKEEKYVLNNYFQYEMERDHWSLQATLGMSYEEILVKGAFVQGQDFPSDQLREVGSAGEITGGNTYEWRASFLSYFARASATLFNSWLLKASVRIDGSSRFGYDTRYGTFPAASVGWILTEEPFLQYNRTLSHLKLRAGWGKTGNVNANPFASRTEFNATSYNQDPGLYLDRLGDPELGWEKTEQLNLGVDIGLFANRVNTSLDYYDKDTRDLRFFVGIPPTNGISGVERNYGNIINTGWEWTLDTKNVITRDFSWSSSVNLAFNNNEIKGLPDGADVVLDYTILREGETAPSFYLVEYAGVHPATGDALFYRNTELPDGTFDRTITTNFGETSRRVMGKPFPDLIGGMTHNFRYKDIDFSFTFQGQWGAQLYNRAGIWQSANADYYDNQTRDQLRRWQQPGDITDVPEARFGATNGNQDSSRYLEDADFVRLRNVTLGYNFPAAITGKLGLDKVRLYCTGLNLLTFTALSGLDPESTVDWWQRAPLYQGISAYSPPPPRTITLGFQVDF